MVIYLVLLATIFSTNHKGPFRHIKGERSLLPRYHLVSRRSWECLCDRHYELSSGCNGPPVNIYWRCEDSLRSCWTLTLRSDLRSAPFPGGSHPKTASLSSGSVTLLLFIIESTLIEAFNCGYDTPDYTMRQVSDALRKDTNHW